MRRSWVGGLCAHDRRRGFARILLIFALTTAMAALAAPADRRLARTGQGVSAPRTVPVTIAWSMAEHFGPGFDRNHDGRPDLPNSYEYVNPGGYDVQLAAAVDTTADPRADVLRLAHRRRRRYIPADGNRAPADGPASSG